MKIILFVVILFWLTNLQAQRLHGVKFVYTHEAHNMHGMPFTYKLYYIIQSRPINIHGRVYNPLIFSEDSTRITGYVRYDSAEKGMYIVYHKDHHIITDTNNKEQIFFPFFKDTLNGNGEKIIVRAKNHDSVFVMEIIEDEIPSDMIIIKELTFFKGEFYPRNIGVFDPFFPGGEDDSVNVVLTARRYR